MSDILLLLNTRIYSHTRLNTYSHVMLLFDNHMTTSWAHSCDYSSTHDHSLSTFYNKSAE